MFQSMRFGIALESFTRPGVTPSRSSIYKMSEKADSLGYDSVWVWDHLLLGSRKVFPVLDSLTTLAMIGARTTRIKLGTSILILALRNPVVLAKVLSTIQFMTNGRLIIGAASGWYKREFDAVGVSFETRGRIFERNFKLVSMLLNENDVNYSSSQFNLEHASMEPKSETKIPLLVGGYSDTVLFRAGRISDGWVSYYYTPEAYAESWRKVEEEALKNGKSPDTLRRVNVVPLAMAPSFAEGDRIAKEFTSKYMDLPKNTSCTPDSAVRGTVTDCVNQVEQFRKVGITDLVFIPCFYDIRLVETAAKDLIPRFE